MRENFLHYLWKYKKFDILNSEAIDGTSISIKSAGQHNLNSGPDFINAHIEIGDQLWAGNVEIHVKSSDWFLHHHELDKNYDNVILHVVWEYDIDIFRKDNSKIPTLVLKDLVSNSALKSYRKLFNKEQKWINCENDMYSVDKFVINKWLEHLYIERLEEKSNFFESLLKRSNNNWEDVLFKGLLKNFGLKVNGDSFFSLANSIDFSIIRKLNSNLIYLESLFFGQVGLLNEDSEDPYFTELKRNYQFLKYKYNLSDIDVTPIQFFRLRPSNFPTIRLSQFAKVYQKHQNLFSMIIEASTLDEFHNIFSVNASNFWNSHYTFNKETKSNSKKLTTAFINLLMINTIIPLKFIYAKNHGNTNRNEIVNLVSQIPSEKNNTITKFNSLRQISTSAMQSQAILQLKSNYCDRNKCLQCAIGNEILGMN